MSGLEIERKFLVRDDSYRRLAFGSSRVKQGYICRERGRTVRVRLRDGVGYITIKGPSSHGGMTRYEFEKEITADEAEELFHLCEPALIDKTRYLVRSGRHVFEVDEFYGDNDGLVVAEVELESEDEPFEKPGFIGEEVTADRRFYNSNLSRFPFAVWKNTLNK